MKLFELFTTQYHVDLKPIKDGASASVEIGGRKLNAHFYQMKDKEGHPWSASFNQERPGNSPTYKLTGSGSEFKVFSYIKQFLAACIEKFDPKTIRILASKEEGRAGVYAKMFRYPGYTTKIQHYSKYDDYVFIRKDEHAGTDAKEVR